MNDVEQVLNQFAGRYRARLLTKLILLAALSLGIVGVLAWRLSAMRVRPVWSIGAPAVLAVVAVGGVAWWGRRRWIPHRHAATYLDQALGLQQRLTTAVEFASAQEPPPLYPLLLEDTSRRYATHQVRFPRPFDRTAASLAVMLLLLLLLPRISHGPSSLITPPDQQVPPQPPPSPEEPPQPPESRQSSQPDQSPTPTPPSSSGQQPSQPQAGDQSNQSQSQRGDRGDQGSQASTSNGREQGKTASQSSEGSQPNSSQGGGEQSSAHGQQQATPSAGDQPSGEQADRQAQEQRGQQAGTSADTDAAQGHDQHAEGRSGQRQGAQQQQSGRQQAEGRQQQATGGAQSASGQQQQGGQRGQSSQGAQSLGNQAALKAEIQELLKQVSGELKELQAQLAAASNQPQPQPGSSTDSQLYGSAEPLEQAGSSSLPMSLQTDTAQTKQSRAGGGVGQPSEDVSHATPQASEEDAALSETPLDEAPTTRQPVPPEYRSIVDRLHRQDARPDDESSAP